MSTLEFDGTKDNYIEIPSSHRRVVDASMSSSREICLLSFHRSEAAIL
jgi:hypothetical protein